MVEMRWIERLEPSWVGVPEGGEPYMASTTRVLQYRVFRTHRITSDRRYAFAAELESWADDYGWTDWMDVELADEE